jgi:hypothetical protein
MTMMSLGFHVGYLSHTLRAARTKHCRGKPMCGRACGVPTGAVYLFYLLKLRVRRSAQYKVSLNTTNAATTATNHVVSKGMGIAPVLLEHQSPKIEQRI